jgi:hypothetical protein
MAETIKVIKFNEAVRMRMVVLDLVCGVKCHFQQYFSHFY